MKSLRHKRPFSQLICVFILLVMLIQNYNSGVQLWNRHHLKASNSKFNVNEALLRSSNGTIGQSIQNKEAKNKTSRNFIDDYIITLEKRVLEPRYPTYHKKPRQNKVPDAKATSLNYNNEALLQRLGNDWQWAFIKKRIQSNWDKLVEGAKQTLKDDLIPGISTKKQVLIFPDVLEGTEFARYAARGIAGPLGELVQWSDLIAGLHILGHVVQLQSNIGVADRLLLNKLSSSNNNGEDGCGGDGFDYFYTDLGGHNKLSPVVKKAYRNKFRILDHFGTEQAYNNQKYSQRNPTYSTGWGGRGFHLKQFYTNYPQTPDNTFLGFMIFNSSTGVPPSPPENRHIAYIYGKDTNLVKGRVEPSQVIPILKKYTEVHSSYTSLPSELQGYGLINHGLLKQEEYFKLTQKIKIVVGLGKPEEGPGPMEAIAKGCILINPATSPNRKYQGKPTNRTLTSQAPYAEKFIGPPYVYTVDYEDSKVLEEIIKLALKIQVKPFIPFELTPGGYLQRLYTLLELQNFCKKQPMWPPLGAMKVVLGDKSRSCNEVCEEQGLVCENLFFPVINKKTLFNNFKLNCQNEVYSEELYAPSYISTTSTCVLQKDEDLYSCASYDGPEPEIRRLCPCRDFIKGQIHMCKMC